MSESYRDRWIECDSEALHIRGYYFPWGTKRIRYGDIRGLRRIRLTLLGGKGRIWGTANLKYWLSLDPRRPAKETGLILDIGHAVHPVITPDDADAVEALIRGKTGISADPGCSPIL